MEERVRCGGAGCPNGTLASTRSSSAVVRVSATALLPPSPLVPFAVPAAPRHPTSAGRCSGALRCRAKITSPLEAQG